MRPFISIMLMMMLGAATAQGNPKTGANFPVAEGSGMQARPAMAYDSNADRFFLAWLDYRHKPTSGLDVFARIVDAAGNGVTQDVPVTRARGSQGWPAVAFDPVNNRFLVVWIDWRDAITIDSDIYGRLFNADGTPYGEEFRITARRRVSQKYPNLAFDPVRQRFLVLWVDDRNEQTDKIYGHFVGADGALQGHEFPVALEGGYQDSPSLIFDSHKDQYLILWRDTQKATPTGLEKAVWGRLLAGRGQPRGATFRIALEKAGCTPLSLKTAGFAPGADSYFVTWSGGQRYNEMMPSGGGHGDRQRGLDVYGAFIDADDGSFRKKRFTIASEIDYQEKSSVSYDPNRDRFLVVWYDLRRAPTNRDSDIYGRYVTPKGAMSEEFLVSEKLASGSRQLPTVAFSPRSDAFLVLWEDERHGGSEKTRIYGATVR